MSATYHVSHYQTVASVEASHFWFRARNAMLAALIGRFIPKQYRGSFLEIGCGTGIVLRVLKNLGFRVTGLDVNEAALTYAKISCPPARFVRQSFYTFQSKQKFSGVGAFDVLEHQTRDRLFLRRCWDMLEEGGTFLLTVPAGKWLWSTLDDIGGHKRRYEQDELREKLRTAGFHVQCMNYWNVFALPWYILFRIYTKRQSSVMAVPMYLHVPHPLVNAMLYYLLRLEQLFFFGVRSRVGNTCRCSEK